MYPQGVCRIRKPACAGNGCAIFPTFNTAQLGKKIRCSAEGDFIRVSPRKKGQRKAAPLPFLRHAVAAAAFSGFMGARVEMACL